MSKEWFADWFDSQYYHLLYQNRDEKEAMLLMDNLMGYLQVRPDAHVIDLACGKGRHAIYLHEKGYKVTGLDLSENSIRKAAEYEEKDLEFQVHDMRNEFQGKKAQIVLNLFTSFGYFETDEEHEKVFHSIYNMLDYKGIFVLDYLNVIPILKTLPTKEIIHRDHIAFNIEKHLNKGFIQKSIRFSDFGKTFEFHEQVKAFEVTQLEKMLQKSGLKTLRKFGNYLLSPFKPEESERLILVSQKVS